ncbi:MAG: ATP-dependent Clp protease proteolytic subunit [Myxococcales bacterium]|nr:ATP-dependent Clp protease proteolytic subunit [Myxococcales bacterium]MDD9967717.1 ATP-dependent Clp protease proteolytic subunit [Myxococcales bacterium]
MTDIVNPGRLEDEIERTLLHHRRIFFSEDVNHESATAAIRKLWYLELKEPGKPITLIINSPGGSVDAGFAVWDQLEMITSPITTLVTGLAASMGSILGQCAPKGRRFATPHCRILIHQPAIHGAIRGQASDLEIQAREILKTRERIVKLYAGKTGKDDATIAAAIERDTWFSAEEAKDFGLIDAVVNSFSDLSPAS